MKFFNKKNWFTLVELVVSMLIMSFILIIIVVFMSGSSKVLIEDNNLTHISQSMIKVKNTLDSVVSKWENEFEILKKPNTYDSILFMKSNLESGILVWVVDVNTKKLKNAKTFWENRIWYRAVSKAELQDIFTNSWVIYDAIFQNDKIFELHTIKDFEAKRYSWNALKKDVLEIDVGVIKEGDSSLNGKNFNALGIPFTEYNYNLVF